MGPLMQLALAMACTGARGMHAPTTPRPNTRLQQKTLQTGGPFDFSDEDRDIAAERVVEEISRSTAANHTARGAPGGAIHFFAESDCELFTSPEACARARRAATYLPSYPCSGNTWARSLFEQTLLIYTGSVFYDYTLRQIGLLGEGNQDPSQVFPIKTHWPLFGGHAEGGEIRNIAIVREPLHAALSWCQLEKTEGQGHHVETPKDVLEEHFSQTVQRKLKMWANMARNYTDGKGIQVVRYEDMVADARRTYLEDIFPYLDVNPGDPGIRERLSAAVARADEAYNSTRRKHTYTFEFTDHHRDLVRTIVGPTLMARLGYQL